MVSYFNLSFGAGLTADGANHLTAVHLNHVVINAQNAFMPRAHVNIIINSRIYLLQVHNVVPERKRALEFMYNSTYETTNSSRVGLESKGKTSTIAKQQVPLFSFFQLLLLKNLKMSGDF